MKKKIINNIFQNLSKNYPEPKSELNYSNSFTFLISVILSAQSTDISVNKATKQLFKIAKTPKDMIVLGEKKLRKHIKTIGLFNIKAKNIISLSKVIIAKFNNKIPKKFNDLISLPGVGTKTASVYQNTILHLPRIAVDTHVFRVSNRIGIVSAASTDLTQIKLENVVPQKWAMIAHHLLILHGRRICKSRKPLCNQCSISSFCTFEDKINYK